MTQQLIVYERAPLNAPALSKLCSLALREVRSLQQARSAMKQAPWSVVALEVQSDNLVQTLETTRWAKSRFPLALVAMPSRSIDPNWDIFLYESGIDLIFRSNLDLSLVSRLIRRQRLRSDAFDANDRRIPIQKQIWQRFPGKDMPRAVEVKRKKETMIHRGRVCKVSSLWGEG